MNYFLVHSNNMMKKITLFILLLHVLFANGAIKSNAEEKPIRYNPTWDSLDKRPLPQWYDEAKVGIFIHWGVFSVPSFGSEWFWNHWAEGSKSAEKFMSDNYPPKFTYQDFARDFTAEFYNPEQWAELFKSSGAKYVVLTSKHHEGYTLWPSKYSFSWNAQDVGPHRNLLGDFVKAMRNNTDLRVGLYHSLYEWFNPLYLEDKESNFSKNTFVENKILPELMELVEQYKPEIVWSDGDWEPTDTYWKSKEFITWLYNESPVKDTVVVNDRWGRGVMCKHGDFFTCSDRYNPGVLQPHKWENCLTLDKSSWGYRRNILLEDFMSAQELIDTLAQTISCGGNILVNVGPTKEGWITPIYQERLTQLGKWLNVNGEAIYSSKPWKYQNDTIGSTWYTMKNNAVYAITLEWPKNNLLELKLAVDLFTKSPKVHLLGVKEPLLWDVNDKKVQIKFPDKATVENEWAWTVKIE